MINNKYKLLNLALLLILTISILNKMTDNSNVHAAQGYMGYAVYRDGVAGNLNDHAAIMDEGSSYDYLPVIQAVGYNDNVKYDSWANFMDGQNFIGVFRPKDLYSISETHANRFRSLARELRGIGYTVFDPIVYDAGSSRYVEPRNITKLRCDGVIEYIYEYYGHRVSGSDNIWDISINSLTNYWEHSGLAVTPRQQHKNHLYKVSSYRP